MCLSVFIICYTKAISFLRFEPVKLKLQNGNETANVGDNKEEGSF